MLFHIRFKRLFYLSLLSVIFIANYNNVESSLSSSLLSFTNTAISFCNIFSSIRNLIISNSNTTNNKQRQSSSSRHTQEEITCEESTCNERLSISIRITPIQDPQKITSTETFIKTCVLANTIKKFKQNGKEMFVARTCMNNILNLQSKDTLIEKIEGGTKTTKSKSIRKKPKLMKPQLVCGGGCCKNCNADKVHKVMAQLTEPILNDDGFDLIKGCNAGQDEPKLVTTSPISGRSIDGIKYMFHICKDDKHIVKKSQYISAFRRYITRPAQNNDKDTPPPTNHNHDNNTTIIPIEEQLEEYEEESKDRNESGVNDTNSAFYNEDYDNDITDPQDGEGGGEDDSGGDNSTSIDEMPFEESPEENNGLGTSSAPACAADTCCKTCVVSDATEEGQYPETDTNQVMNVLFETNSSIGVIFASDCATAGITEVSVDIYSMTICKDDFDTMQNDGSIKSIIVQEASTTDKDEIIKEENNSFSSTLAPEAADEDEINQEENNSYSSTLAPEVDKTSEEENNEGQQDEEQETDYYYDGNTEDTSTTEGQQDEEQEMDYYYDGIMADEEPQVDEGPPMIEETFMSNPYDRH